MSSAPDSSAEFSSVGDAPRAAVDLVERHRQLRMRLRWLLPVGTALLLLLAYQLITLPRRAALTGYRYRQVGVQPDSTWWILAYRDGKAELLFSRDTAQGWQRRELGVDSTEARALALNWGGQALLVGEGGAVRVYDSLFQQVDSVRHPLGRAFQACWVAADNSGQRAVVLGDSGQTLFSADSGRTWRPRVASAGLNFKKRSQRQYWRERAVFGVNDELNLANRSDFIRVSTGAPLSYRDGGRWIAVSYIPLAKAGIGTWAQPTDSVPVIYFSLDSVGAPQILRQDGSAKTPARHYPPAELTDKFPVAFKPIDAALSPGRPGFCLIISPTRVFAGRLGGPFAASPPTAKQDSAAAQSSKDQPDITVTNASKKESAKTKKNTSLTQQKKIPFKSQPIKPAIKPETNPPNPTGRDTTGDAAALARKRAQAQLKSGQQNPNQQPTRPDNPAIQKTPPANDPKPQPTKEDNLKKPESAR